MEIKSNENENKNNQIVDESIQLNSIKDETLSNLFFY